MDPPTDDAGVAWASWVDDVKEKKIRIRFLKSWGHPTRNQIMGEGEVWEVSLWAAENLISGGYAELVKEEQDGAAKNHNG